MPKFSINLIPLITVVFLGRVVAQIPPKDAIPPMTLSPDGCYGITVPKFEDYQDLDNPFLNGPRNQIVEIKTKKVLGSIQADTAFDRMNEAEVVPPLWALDDSIVLWQVDGKWGFDTEMLLELVGGRIKTQINVLDLLQQEILKRTRDAVPDKYAAVKAKSAGYGSWFKDGFAIDCVLSSDGGSLKFPLLFHVFLTSNTKAIEGEINLDSRMTAEVNRVGTIKVDDFHLGNNPPARDFIRPSQLQSGSP